MKSAPNAGPASIERRSDRFHRWRNTKDKLARRIIGLGGFVVIGAVLLIMFYLLFVVIPLFTPAKISQHTLGERQDWQEQATSFLALEEQQQVALRVNQQGLAEFIDAVDLRTLDSFKLTDKDKTVLEPRVAVAWLQ